MFPGFREDIGYVDLSLILLKYNNNMKNSKFVKFLSPDRRRDKSTFTDRPLLL